MALVYPCPVQCCSRDRGGLDFLGRCGRHVTNEAEQCENCLCVVAGAIVNRPVAGNPLLCEVCWKKYQRNSCFTCPVVQCKQPRTEEELGVCNDKHRNAKQCENCYRVFGDSVKIYESIGKSICRRCADLAITKNGLTADGDHADLFTARTHLDTSSGRRNEAKRRKTEERDAVQGPYNPDSDDEENKENEGDDPEDPDEGDDPEDPEYPRSE